MRYASPPMPARRKRGQGEGSIYAEKGRQTPYRARISWTDEDGTRHRVSLGMHPTRTEASRAIDRAKADLAAGRQPGQAHAPAPAETVGEYGAAWLAKAVAAARKVRTGRSYEEHWRIHIEPALGAVPIAKLTHRHIERWQAGMLAAGLLPVSVRHIRSTLSKLIGAMRRDGLLASSPLDLEPPPPMTRHKAKPPAPADVAKVLDAMSGYHFEVFFWVLALTALRSEEARGLRPHNVNVNEGWIEVERVLIRHKGEWLLEPPKNDASAARVQIPAALAERLAAFLAAWQPSPANPLGLLFTTFSGGPIGDERPSRELRWLCKIAGVPVFNAHALRHAVATTLLNLPPGQRPSLEQVSRLLRHGSVATTADIYGHILEGTLKAVAGQLEGAYLAPVGRTLADKDEGEGDATSVDAP